MKKAIVATSCLLALTWGCSHTPKQVTSFRSASYTPLDSNDSLDFDLISEGSTAIRSEGVFLTFVLQNRSSEPILIERDPMIQLFWTFKNGRRDNEVIDPPVARAVLPEDSVTLQPLGTHTITKHVETDYFRTLGPVTFQAMLYSCPNEDPEPQNWWVGKVASNKINLDIRKSWHEPSYINHPSVTKNLEQPSN